MKALKYITLILIAALYVRCSTPVSIEVFGSLKGVVMDEFVQKPVSGASVTLAPLGKTIITQSDGSFEFNDLDAAEYIVTVSKDSYTTDSKKITVQPNVVSEASFAINTANGAVQLSKDVLDFGKENTTLAFDITNIGVKSLFFVIVSESYDWLKVSPASGEIKSSNKEPITITVDRDKIKENKRITLPITSNMGSDEIEIDVTYNPAAPVMVLSKTTLDFGEYINTLGFDVKNTGKATLEFSVKDTEDWITFSSDVNTLEPGEIGSVIVKIDRTKINSNINAEFSVTSNAGSQDIQVKAIYVEKLPEISVSKATLDFGKNDNTLSFDIENTGDADLEFSISENYNWISFSPSSRTISPGGITSITTIIDRSALSESKSENFTIISNAGSKNIKVSVTYVPKYPELSISKSSLNFGLNNNSLSFTITNSGDADLNYWISENEDWIRFSPSSRMSVKPHESVNVTATIDRDEILSNINRSFEISSNANTCSINVQVTCGYPEMSVSENYFDFGASTEFESSEYFTIKNSGDAELEYSITSDAYVKFSPASKSLDPGESTTVKVTINRYSINLGFSSFTKNYTITSNGGNSSITVKVTPTDPFAL